MTIVIEPRIEEDQGGLAISFTLGDDEHRVWFTSSETVIPNAETTLAATLLPAMRAKTTLRLVGPVSDKLLSNVPMIQDIFRAWNRDKFDYVRIESEPNDATQAPAIVSDKPPGVGCFFSGGADSFHTLLKNQDEITHLIFGYGLGLPRGNQKRRDQAHEAVQSVANELGKTFVEVDTNIQPFSNDTQVGWVDYHGAAMASVALLHQHILGKVFIPSSHTYADLFPWGSHPLLDPLWSTERTEIQHYGSGSTRVEKIAHIAQHDLALKWLRVCNRDREEYNCGRCSKCVRTMVNLRAVGALERCETLPHTISPEKVASMPMGGENGLSFARENLLALKNIGTEPELVKAYEEAIEKSTPENEINEQLDKTKRNLQDTRRSRAAFRVKSEKLTKRVETLEKENAHLKARQKGRRYVLADALVGNVVKLPGVTALLKKLR